MGVAIWPDRGPAQRPLEGPSVRGGVSTAGPARRHVIAKLPSPLPGHTSVSTQSPLEPASVRRTRTVAVATREVDEAASTDLRRLAQKARIVRTYDQRPHDTADPDLAQPRAGSPCQL